jgi:hypothetical protein
VLTRYGFEGDVIQSTYTDLMTVHKINFLKPEHFSMPSQLPPHVKIQRAKAIVDDEGEKFLTTCESCDKEVYLPEGEMICEECKLGRKTTIR